ncbi:MAG: hypothetical protein M0C28_16535 [Candidatus Moduliflexus flocculans]|nr:hypothetical protein [Candidatus Moduliflexus flocculans]
MAGCPRRRDRAAARHADAMAQTPYMPYYGKNLVQYDRFDWQIYTTEHFEIYYYPAIEQHLERVAGYAESAYQQISAELKHDLAFKVPADHLQDAQRVRAAERHPGRGAGRRRRLRRAVPRTACCCRSTSRRTCCYRLIVHELTHIFEFDIVPQSLIRADRAAVGGGGPLGLHDRHLAAGGPDDGPRRRASPT